MLEELVDILSPFAQATDVVQGEKYATIGCVVPTIVCLHKFLAVLSSFAKFHFPMVNTLQQSLAERFNGILHNINIDPPKNVQTPNKANITFYSQLYLIAKALNPSYSLLWLDDHPGSNEVKKQVKERVISVVTREVSSVLASQIQTTTNSNQPEISIQPVKKTRISRLSHMRKDVKKIQVPNFS